MKRASLVFLVLLVALSVAKLTFLQYEIGMLESPFIMVLANMALVTGLYAPLLLLSSRGRRRWGIGVNLVLSALVLADIIYFRFYGSVLPVYAIFLIHQVGGVSDSVRMSIEPAYLLLFADVILLGCYFARHKVAQRDYLARPHRLVAGLLVFVSVIAVTYTGSIASHYVNNTRYSMARFGALFYHAHDVVSFARYATAFGADYDDRLPAGWEKYLPRSSSEIPAEQRQHYGVAQGRNIIVIQAESIQDFVLGLTYEGQEVTPNLNRLLANDSLYFSNYFQMTALGNTSDAEFSTHNALPPSLQRPSYQAYERSSFYTLPLALQSKGYRTLAFHGNDAFFWNRASIYPAQGFDEFFSAERLDMDELIGMGLSDESFFEQAAGHLAAEEGSFYAFLATLTSHTPFIMPEHIQEAFPVRPEHENLVGYYLQSVHYLDRTIGEFIDSLKSEGLYDNSVIAIYGDHHGISAEDKEAGALLGDMLGRIYDYDTMMNVPLIVHIPGAVSAQEISTVGGQFDFFPTMLNLLGMKPEQDSLLLGRDLVNATHGFAPLQTFMIKGSFVDDERMFIVGRDGTFENGWAIDLKTGLPADLESCREGFDLAVLYHNVSEWHLLRDRVRGHLAY